MTIFNRRRIRRGVGALLLLVTSVSVCLGAFELLLRWNVIPNAYYLENQVLGDVNQSGLFTFIVGDSFIAATEPFVADYVYPMLAPYGVRIRNTATPGTGPVQYLESLRREGARYRPKVVLLSYYVGNDLADVGCEGNLDERLLATRSPPAWKRIYTAQYVREVLRRVFPGKVIFAQSLLSGEPMGQASPRLLALASFHWSFASIFSTAQPFSGSPRSASPPHHNLPHSLRVQEVDYDRMKEAGIPEEYIESAKAGELNPWIVYLGAQNPDYFRDQLLMRSECAQQAWESTKRVLDMILDEAARLDADVFPVIFPHTLQVNTAHYGLYRAWKINVDDEMLRTSRPQQLLREYFHSHDLEPLDLLDAFRTDGELLYWDQDEHMNLRGQQLSGRLIAEGFLTRYGDDDVP